MATLASHCFDLNSSICLPVNFSICIQVMQLRKACSHPYLFPGIEPEPYEEGEHLVQVALCSHESMWLQTSCLRIKEI